MEELQEKPQKKDIIINHIITVLGVLGIIATIILFYIGFSKGLLRKPVLRYTNADIYNCTVCKQ